MNNSYPRVLYHVTPASNLASIYESGLQPNYSEGLMKVVWLVGKRNIVWAIAHCSNRHSESVDNLAVMTIPIDDQKIVRFATSGLFYCKHIIQVENHAIAALFIPAESDVI